MLENHQNDLNSLSLEEVQIEPAKVSKKNIKTNKKTKKLKSEKIDPTQQKIDLLAAKLEVLENEISQKDEKLAKLENAQMTLKMGEDEFGTGQWKKLIRGKEKGYIRSIYIDVEAMAGLNKTPHIHG